MIKTILGPSTSILDWRTSLATRRILLGSQFVSPPALAVERLKYGRTDQLDEFDRRNYILNAEGRWVSAHAENFVLSSLQDAALKLDPDYIDGREFWEKGISIELHEKYFAGLSHFPVIRKDGFSIYLVDGHRWALWGWIEAILRGDLERTGCLLVHIDKHDDSHENCSPCANNLVESCFGLTPTLKGCFNITDEKNGVRF